MKSCISLTDTVNIANTLSQRIHYNEKDAVLTSKERLIVYAMISLLEPEDTKFEEFRYNITKFCRLLKIDMNGGLQKKRFSLMLEKLHTKGFCIEDAAGKEIRISRWMKTAYYDRNTKEVVLQLSNELRPYLLNLTGKSRTLFQLGYAINFKLRHTATLYALLHSAVGRKDYRIPIERFRNMLGTPYPKYFDIKHFVLEPSFAEINRHSDIWVAEKPIRKGKVVVGISFYVRYKTKKERKKIEKYKFPDNRITEKELMALPSGDWSPLIPYDDDDWRREEAIRRKKSYIGAKIEEYFIRRLMYEPSFVVIPIFKHLWNHKRRKRNNLKLALQT